MTRIRVSLFPSHRRSPLCACKSACGDADEKHDEPYAVCKGLAVKKEPLVEIVLVLRG